MIVMEEDIEKQYEWFKNQSWFNKDYETFKRDNFLEIENND